MTTAVAIFLGCLLLFNSAACKDPKRKTVAFPNDLKNSNWIIDMGGLIRPDSEQSYYLSKQVDTLMIVNFQALSFLNEESFKSYDSWECGNDCFTEVHGRYTFMAADQLKMEVDSISESGTCQAPTQIFKPAKSLTFRIIKEADQLKLIRAPQ